MRSDISRVRFDPHRNFAGVVMQQGRLLLDADFNEYVALLDRRLRAETSDLTSFGPDDQQGVAWVPRETPDGFRVTASGGDLSIGRGRMYVDGLLAENHGIELDGFDPLLSERTGTADMPYGSQPYWPTPDPLPSGGPHLAYLDVWQREVTHLEDPGLVEVAVGVDSTARLQTAWQVRLLPNVGAGVTCASDDDDIPGWLDVIRPSAGRLSTGTVEVAADDDPCELPPSGGYRGLENQTYRVEVHSGGAPGTATFKWSRDNGSVASPVVEMVSSTVLRLASVGKDDVLRVSTGDWVEILDDRYELGRKPGVMRKVTVDDAARTITFTGALPADLQPANATEAAARHLRVRRWDQGGVVKSGAGATLVDLDAPGSTGLITVPTGTTTKVVLEHGVAVSFSVAPGAGGQFRAGDHWIFAARTADTSVEILDAAPPLGVHHHYARLGIVSFPDNETDCRRLWPPLATGGDHGCDCTVCVTPEQHASGALTVQAAIDLVKSTGGTVCLAAGVYDLGAGVNADGARSVRIRGQGPATILVARGTAITAQTAIALTVESLAVVSGTAAAPAIRLRSTIGAVVQDVVVLSYGNEGGGSGIELSGVALGGAIRRNVIVGRTGIHDGGGPEQIGVLAAALRIEGNVVVGLRRGVDLGGRSAYVFSCRVGGNEVLAGAEGGIVATGVVAPGGTLEVAANKIASGGGPGIEVGADATVDANAVNRLGDEPDTPPDGIVVAAGGFPAPAGHVRITGNRVHDRAGLGIVLRTAVRTFMVKQNVVTGVGSGIGIEETGSAEHAAVDNNVVVDVAAARGQVGFALGIVVMRAGSAAVHGNRVARLGLDLQEAAVRAGILVLASGDVRVGGNVVDEAGPPELLSGFAIGIGVIGPFESASVQDNSSRYSPAGPPPEEGRWHALVVQSAAAAGSLRFGERSALVGTESGALFIAGTTAFAAAGRAEHAGIGANTLSGGGELPTCLVRVTGDVTAHGNQVEHEGREPGAMLLQGTSASATGNRVRGREKAMLVLVVPENRFAAVANLAAGGTHLGGPGGGLPSPWDALNPTVP